MARRAIPYRELKRVKGSARILPRYKGFGDGEDGLTGSTDTSGNTTMDTIDVVVSPPAPSIDVAPPPDLFSSGYIFDSPNLTPPLDLGQLIGLPSFTPLTSGSPAKAPVPNPLTALAKAIQNLLAKGKAGAASSGGSASSGSSAAKPPTITTNQLKITPQQWLMIGGGLFLILLLSRREE